MKAEINGPSCCVGFGKAIKLWRNELQTWKLVEKSFFWLLVCEKIKILKTNSKNVRNQKLKSNFSAKSPKAKAQTTWSENWSRLGAIFLFLPRWGLFVVILSFSNEVSDSLLWCLVLSVVSEAHLSHTLGVLVVGWSLVMSNCGHFTSVVYICISSQGHMSCTLST